MGAWRIEWGAYVLIAVLCVVWLLFVVVVFVVFVVCVWRLCFCCCWCRVGGFEAWLTGVSCIVAVVVIAIVIGLLLL